MQLERVCGIGELKKKRHAKLFIYRLLMVLAFAGIVGCEVDRRHEPYSTRGKKGPSLKGVFQNKYLSLSGLPANDERVADIIRLGRNEMPGYSQTLSSQDIQDLLAYLHTL